MSLLQRARESGKCPPSLIGEDRATADGGFEAAVLKVLDGQNGLVLGSDVTVPSGFDSVLQMADSVTRIPEQTDDSRKVMVLEYRRCIILAVVGVTPAISAPLNQILTNGFFLHVKSWLEDILSGSVGGVDLLLHMLVSVSDLPVSKQMVVSSGLGKAIGAVEKHKICVGTLNETAIKEKIQLVKHNWNASVKARRAKSRSSESSSKKRGSDQPEERSPAKRAKQSSTFSSLLKKVSTSGSPPPVAKTPDSREGTPAGVKAVHQEPQELEKESSAPTTTRNELRGETSPQKTGTAKKSATKRVKWADHFGGQLESAHEIETTAGDQVARPEDEGSKPISWSDRRKRDRLREKELFAKAKKSKIIDDDDDVETPTMKITAPWRQPKGLPSMEGSPDVNSSEMATQGTRIATTTAVRYISEADIPSSPAPLSDVDQAVDMASQSSTVSAVIPFFAPPPEPTTISPAPAPVMPPPQKSVVPPPLLNTSLPPPPLPAVGVAPGLGVPASNGASAETVLAMGLPLFLVGSNVKALQTLASTPGLLNTFVDSNGAYDQTRLMNLVQTLTAPEQTSQPVANLTTGYQQQTGVATTAQSAYQAIPPQSSVLGTSTYGATQSRSAYRGDQNNAENNLHVSGYGLSTTQTDILALFSPYVKVDEVVMKNGFSFVNTSDPSGAKRAKEALSGALLGGSPIRINIAQRRGRDSGPTYGAAATNRVSTTLPRNAYGQVDLDQVRDDRGNPATKNLFVAGYGTGTSEQNLRDIFSQHATITGCVMKGTFSFVNTTDKQSAVSAREALTGSIVNGGVLRINFAKETGRLGTSFDTTYGPNTRSPYARPVTYS